MKTELFHLLPDDLKWQVFEKAMREKQTDAQTMRLLRLVCKRASTESVRDMDSLHISLDAITPHHLVAYTTLIPKMISLSRICVSCSSNSSVYLWCRFLKHCPHKSLLKITEVAFHFDQKPLTSYISCDLVLMHMKRLPNIEHIEFKNTAFRRVYFASDAFKGFHHLKIRRLSFTGEYWDIVYIKHINFLDLVFLQHIHFAFDISSNFTSCLKDCLKHHPRLSKITSNGTVVFDGTTWNI